MMAHAGGVALRATRGRQALRLFSALERRPGWSVFALALVVRVAAAVGIAVVNPSNISPDGVLYSQMAAQKAAGHTASWSAYLHTLYHATGALLVPLTWLYRIFGPHHIVGQLYVALLGAGAAALAFRLAREVLPVRWAVAAGAVVALLPSQIVWSSLVLKDSSVWIVLIGLALTLAVAARSNGRRLLLMGLVAAALLVLLGYLRVQTLIIASWALMLAAPLGPRPNRAIRAAGALALGVLIPWLIFHRGPAGIRYVEHAPPPTTIRRGMVQYAHTVIPGAAPPASTAAPRRPAAKPPVKPPSGTQSTKPPTAPSAPPSEVGTDLRHLPQGLLAMLVEPYPWQNGGSVYLNLARLEALVWYPLLALALVGVLSVRRRHLRALAFPLIAAGAILVSYALIEGNLGTAFRHRGEVEWVIALLAMVGLRRVAAWRRGRGASAQAAGLP